MIEAMMSAAESGNNPHLNPALSSPVAGYNLMPPLNTLMPVGLSVMLRIYFLQHWFALSDPGA